MATAKKTKRAAHLKASETVKPASPIGDAAKAFEITSAMEDDLTAIEHMMHALHWIAEGSGEPRESGALYGIANSIQDALERAQEKQGQCFSLLHKCRFPPGPQTREGKIAKAFFETVKELPKDISPAMIRKRTWPAVRAKEPCTKAEFKAVVRKLEPMLERAGQ